MSSNNFAYAQQEKSVRGEKTVIYRNNGENNGPALVTFQINYMLQNYAGSVYLRIDPMVLEDNRGKGYYYKGVEYFGNLIPEVNNVSVKDLNLTVTVTNSVSGNVTKNMMVTLGGNNGLLGGNSMMFLAKTPEGFYNVLTTVSIEVNSITIKNFEAANASITRYLSKQKQEEAAKNNLAKYNDLMNEGKSAFSSQNYQEAQTKFLEAIKIKVPNNEAQSWIDKIKAEKLAKVKNEQTQSTNTSSSQNGQSKGTQNSSNQKSSTNQRDDFWDEKTSKSSSSSSNSSKSTTETAIQKKERQAREQNEMLRKQREDTERRRLENERKVAVATANISTTFYAMQNVSDAKDRLNSNSRLSGNFSSIAELEREFNQKYQEVAYNAREWKEAADQSTMAAANLLFNDGTAKNEALGALVGTVGTLFNSEEKQKREAREQLERDKARFVAEMEAKRKAALIAIRTQLLKEFPDGGTPLSKHNIKNPEVYFFFYSFNKELIGNNNPKIIISNVFSVAKFNDDTWPYKESFVKNIKTKTQLDDIVLMGYYTDKSLANEMQNTLVSLSKKSEMQAELIKYEINKEKKSESYWAESSNKNTETNKKTTDDFWSDSSSSSKSNKTTEKPKSTPKKEEDFWK